MKPITSSFSTSDLRCPQSNGIRNDETLSKSKPNKPDLLVIPEEFICPITQEIMINPVLSRYGQSYERKAIVEWLATGRRACPLTRQPLNLQNLVTNRSLQLRIKGFLREHGVVTSNDEIQDDNDECPNAASAAFFDLPDRETHTDHSSDDDEELREIRVRRVVGRSQNHHHDQPSTVSAGGDQRLRSRWTPLKLIQRRSVHL